MLSQEDGVRSVEPTRAFNLSYAALVHVRANRLRDVAQNNVGPTRDKMPWHHMYLFFLNENVKRQESASTPELAAPHKLDLDGFTKRL